jgi:hypothetical protein
LALADVDGDGDLDLFVGGRVLPARYPEPADSLLLTNTGGRLVVAQRFEKLGLVSGAVFSDLDGDGKLDVATAGPNGVSVLVNAGGGSFGAAIERTTGLGPAAVAIGDVSGDGQADLVVTNNGSNTVSVLLNTGGGSFAAKQDYATGALPLGVAIGDVNGDGAPDLVVTNNGSHQDPGTTVSVLLGVGDGSFGDKTDFGTGPGPASVAIGDVNGDGLADWWWRTTGARPDPQNHRERGPRCRCCWVWATGASAGRRRWRRGESRIPWWWRWGT